MEAHKAFCSNQELKDYYLKESVLLLSDMCTPGCTETECFTLLQAEQKQILNFLKRLVVASFDLGLDNLYDMTSAYMMCDDIAKEERIQTCADMRKLFSVFSLLQQKLDLTSELYNLYAAKCVDVQRLLEAGDLKK